MTTDPPKSDADGSRVRHAYRVNNKAGGLEISSSVPILNIRYDKPLINLNRGGFMSISNVQRRWTYPSLFEDYDKLFNQMSRPLELFRANGDGEKVRSFAIDIRENDEQFEIFADVPGLSEDELDITVNKHVLTIKGERTTENTERDGDRFVRTERVSGKFERLIQLPESADLDKIAAKLDKGVLRLTVPKREAEQPRRIEFAVDA